MKAGSAAALPLVPDQQLRRAGSWTFAVEIFPPEWKCPAAEFWIAGWILSETGQGAADVRAWLGARLFLGWCGLPRTEIETTALGRPGPPHAGFSFLLRPDPAARELRLEACGEDGRWREFFRQAITPSTENTLGAKSKSVDAAEVSRTLLGLLVARRAQPSSPLDELADEALRSAFAIPLDALPVPPFYGRLELPAANALVRFGLLEISGWIARRAEKIKRLLAFVGPSSPVMLIHGRPREDVDDAFGPLRDGATSQFIGYIEVPAHLPLPWNLRILAELENGQQHLVFNQRFRPQVVVESPAFLPPFSVFTFGQATGALWRAARRHGWKFESAAVFRHGLRDAWAEYRVTAPMALRASVETPSAAQSTSRPAIEVILVTHNLNREGAPLIALEFAAYLAKQPGWKIRVVSAEDGSLRSPFLAAGVPIEIVDVSAIWQAKNPEELEAVIGRLAAQCGWDTADVVVANTMVSFWAVHVAHRLRKPSLLYVHESSSVRRFFAPLTDAKIIPEIEKAFGCASHVVFSAAATQFAHRRLERGQNFRVLPGWIDTHAIQAYAAVHPAIELRRVRRFADDAVIFANVGSVCERKGQHVFVQAIELLRRKRRAQKISQPPLTFLIVGAAPGPFVDFLRHEVARLALDEVLLIDKVADAYEYFRLADIFVCSSFEESLPRVVLEAAAFGLPIVTTAVNGVPEIVGPAEAWLVPPGNADELAAAMESALEAHLARDRTRSERAQRKVGGEFDSAVLLPRHAALVAAVATKSRG